MRTRLLVLALVATSLAACGSSGTVSTLAGFPETTEVTIDERELVLAVADTPGRRGRGLMGVTDLGDLDGMLFVFGSETETGFWMKDTLIPLDIAFFTAGGAFVDRLVMEPCTTEECPTYFADGSYRYAIEAPEGALAFVGPGSGLILISE